jgi:hypothetical protein
VCDTAGAYKPYNPEVVMRKVVASLSTLLRLAAVSAVG